MDVSSPFDRDARAVERLGDVLDGRDRRTMRRASEAAVLVPVIDDGGPLRILLTRRTETVGTHKGQVSFPGGRSHPEDDGPVDTALREAEEEIGLHPSAVEILGLLDDYPTVTQTMVVTPVVGRITELPPLKPQPSEVARIFEIPVESLLESKGWIARHHPSAGGWPVFYFDFDGETLWGLSAFITLHLLDLSGLGAPVEAFPRGP